MGVEKAEEEVLYCGDQGGAIRVPVFCTRVKFHGAIRGRGGGLGPSTKSSNSKPWFLHQTIWLKPNFPKENNRKWDLGSRSPQ